MKTEIFESDPFTPRKGRLLATIDTDYRFEKNDELSIETAISRLPLRVMNVQIRIREGVVSREILALKL